MNIYILIAALAGGLLATFVTWMIMRGNERLRVSSVEEKMSAMQQQYEARLAVQEQQYETRLSAQEQQNNTRIADMEKMAAKTQENYEKALKETVVSGMTAETEKLLKAREKELKEGNQSSIDGILKPLKESITAMEKAMKSNEVSHLETTTKLSEQLKQAVKDMQEKTSDVGRKADTLSEALTGKPKVQGCFGENFLDAILAGEGLEEGKHYSREAANEDLSRPDFVFHFKEGLEQKDLIVDSKVSLTAFVDYMNAASDDEKAAALDRHIKSVRKHIGELSKKE